MPVELGDAVDERRRSPRRSARATSSSEARRVLDGVVQQRGAQRLGVEPHAGADLRDADRVDDEVLARLAPLVGVVLAGEDERVARPRSRSTGIAVSSACSSTIANRSPSSRARSASGRRASTGAGVDGMRRRRRPAASPASTATCAVAPRPCAASPACVMPRRGPAALSSLLAQPSSCRPRSRGVVGPVSRRSARARCARRSSEPPGPAGPGRGSTSPSSARTRSSRPASDAERPCGPSPRSSARAPRRPRRRAPRRAR